MKRAKITFAMTVDGRTETRFSTDGTVGGGILDFPDGEGGNYRIDYDETMMRIRRDGPSKMDFVLTDGKRSTGVLMTSGITFHLAASTRRMHVADDRVELEYDLLEGGRVLSHHLLTIAWQ